MAEEYWASERRPVAARETRWAGAAAGWLARRGVPPNAISLAGMFCAIAAGGSLAATSAVGLPELARRALFLASAALIQLRLLANLLDGMVAVSSGRASPVGELYNEVPDRVSDAMVLAGLGWARGGDATLGLVAGCFAIFVAYVRAECKVAGAAQDYRGPMAKQQRMFLVTLSALFQALAPEAWQPVWTDHAWGVPAATLAAIVAGCAVTAARRLGRAARTLREGDRG